MALDPAALDLPVLTSLAGSAVDERLLRDLRAAGHRSVRRSHGYVIQLLVEEEPTVTEIASRLGISQQAASKSVADLERLGYVERRADDRDRRARRVSMTTRGRELLSQTRELRQRLAQELLDVAGADDVAAARRTLHALLGVTGAREAVAARRVPLPED